MIKKLPKFILILFIFALLLSISGCVPGDGSNSYTHIAGFFTGIWHGWIAPFTLIYSIFDHNIGIYEIYNNGFAYNFGYYMAIISGFGGLALSRKKKSSGYKDDNRY